MRGDRMQTRLFSYKPAKKQAKGYISGGNMNHLVKLTSLADVDCIPLDKRADLIDDSHISLLSIDSENGIMGAPYKDDEGVNYVIDAKTIKDMGFEDDEVFVAQADTEHGLFVLSNGKDYYKFAIKEQSEPKVPPLDLSNKFKTTGKKFSELYSKQNGRIDENRYIRFDFGDGVDGVLKEGDEEFGPKVKMTTAKQKKAGKVLLPAYKLDKLDDVADEIEVEMDTDYPIKLSFTDPTYKAAYLVAPRIENDNRKPRMRHRAVKSNSVKKKVAKPKSKPKAKAKTKPAKKKPVKKKTAKTTRRR